MKKGFTLVELIVVILIIGILAAVALPMYSRAVERSRLAEVTALFGTVRKAQDMLRMKKHSYSCKWKALSFVDLPNSQYTDLYCLHGADAQTDSQCPSTATSFKVNLCGEGELKNFGVRAERANSEVFGNYQIYTYYDDPEQTLYCQGETEQAKALCADFLGVDEYSEPARPSPCDKTEEGEVGDSSTEPTDPTDPGDSDTGVEPEPEPEPEPGEDESFGDIELTNNYTQTKGCTSISGFFFPDCYTFKWEDGSEYQYTPGGRLGLLSQAVYYDKDGNKMFEVTFSNVTGDILGMECSSPDCRAANNGETIKCASIIGRCEQFASMMPTDTFPKPQ